MRSDEERKEQSKMLLEKLFASEKESKEIKQILARAEDERKELKA